MPDVVIFPDYQGRSSLTGDFARALRNAVPGVTVVAAINGVDVGPFVDSTTEYVYCRSNFNSAVLTGLTRAAELGERVARVDTNEHDIRLLATAFSLLNDADIVILDMVYDSSTLRPESVEYYHTNFVIPSIVSFATNHRFSLSGCHGFMSFRRTALERILPIVEEVLKIANDTELHAQRPPIRWSADSLLPIIADRLGLRVKVVRQPATVLRENSSEKCARQAWDLRCLLDVLDRTLPA